MPNNAAGPSNSTAHYKGVKSRSSTFTSRMRDRQARGKDPLGADDSGDTDYEDYTEGDDDGEGIGNEDDDDDDDEGDDGDDGNDGTKDGDKKKWLKLGHGPRVESFEDWEKRGYAMSVLDNHDLLMMHAQSTGDSIPGQRLRFMHLFCGFSPPKPANKKRGSRQSQQHQKRPPHQQQQQQKQTKQGGSSSAR